MAEDSCTSAETGGLWERECRQAGSWKQEFCTRCGRFEMRQVPKEDQARDTNLQVARLCLVFEALGAIP